MKILYRQSLNGEKKTDLLSLCGINNCFFKYIRQLSGDGNYTKKRHSHNGFEFHIMLDGRQTYETDGGRFLLDGGKVLAVPKGVPHKLVSASYPITKYAFTFTLENFGFDADTHTDCILFEVSERLLSNIRAIKEMSGEIGASNILIQNAVFESILILLREIGIFCSMSDSSPTLDAEKKGFDERVELAVQFIEDNIETPLQVGEVASYCYISEKQLNRLFLRETGATVAVYIRMERIKKIEELLTDTTLSLSDISERFGFPSEHGFNLFFKKYNGMPPGEYRKMTKNGKE